MGDAAAAAAVTRTAGARAGRTATRAVGLARKPGREGERWERIAEGQRRDSRRRASGEGIVRRARRVERRASVARRERRERRHGARADARAPRAEGDLNPQDGVR